jgi:hypothetical protein
MHVHSLWICGNGAGEQQENGGWKKLAQQKKNTLLFLVLPPSLCLRLLYLFSYSAVGC